MSPRENPHLFGHDAAERTLMDALAGGRLHHAWLITGPDGVGKATLAFRFARRLLAGRGGLDMAAADPVFRRVAAGGHADLLVIEREWDDKKKRLKRNISAESVRAAPGFLHLTAAEGGWRVVIIDGAEDMNQHSANALLKVLEEPPARAALLLVSAAPGRLLPTILSRCRHLALAPLGAEDMARALALILPGTPPADRARLAAEADGSPGRALLLAEEGGLAFAETIRDLLAALPDLPLLRGYELADRLREEAAFETFFQLLRRAIAGAVLAAARGTATADQARLAGLKPAGRWGEVWAELGRLEDETLRFSLDRRQAVVAGLALLR